jgi:hypothetical protein
MRSLFLVVLGALAFAACGEDSLQSALNRALVSGTVLLDSVPEPATVSMIRESTGDVGDSEPTNAAGFYELADEYDGLCDWRVEVDFTNINEDAAFLATLSGPLFVENLGCTSQTVDFDLRTN